MSLAPFERQGGNFSKKLENHACAVALHFMYYNFCRIHKTLRVTPAMQAGIADHVWRLDELCALLPEPVVKKSATERELVLAALENMSRMEEAA